MVLTFGSVNETFLAALWHCAMVLFASQHFTMSPLWFKSPSLQIYRVSDYLCVIYWQIDTLAAFRMILHLFILWSAGVLVDGKSQISNHYPVLHQLSSTCNIDTLSSKKVMSYNPQNEIALIFYQILSTDSVRNLCRSVLRICLWILGIKRSTPLHLLQVPV